MKKVLGKEYFVSLSSEPQNQDNEPDEPQLDPLSKVVVSKCFICKNENKKHKSAERFCQICKKAVCADKGRHAQISHRS